MIVTRMVDGCLWSKCHLGGVAKVGRTKNADTRAGNDGWFSIRDGKEKTLGDADVSSIDTRPLIGQRGRSSPGAVARKTHPFPLVPFVLGSAYPRLPIRCFQPSFQGDRRRKRYPASSEEGVPTGAGPTGAHAEKIFRSSGAERKKYQERCRTGPMGSERGWRAREGG